MVGRLHLLCIGRIKTNDDLIFFSHLNATQNRKVVRVAVPVRAIVDDEVALARRLPRCEGRPDAHAKQRKRQSIHDFAAQRLWWSFVRTNSHTLRICAIGDHDGRQFDESGSKRRRRIRIVPPIFDARLGGKDRSLFQQAVALGASANDRISAVQIPSPRLDGETARRIYCGELFSFILCSLRSFHSPTIASNQPAPFRSAVG